MYTHPPASLPLHADMFPSDDLCYDADTFAPILKEDLTAQKLPKPLPLTTNNFTAEDTFTDALVDSVSNIESTLADGFYGPNASLNPSAVLNCEQWLRIANIVMHAVQHGLQRNYDTSDTNHPYNDVSPDEQEALDGVGTAARNLHSFFIKDWPKGPMNSNQCVHCLQVSGATVTYKNWEAQLRQCNYNAAAARHLILNQYKDTLCRKADTCLAEQCLRAQNQIIELITSNNPPPHLETDPRLVEWIT
jgi:hypothetical protein